MSSPAETLGSWVRSPLEAWMSTRVSSVFVSYVGMDLRQGWSPVQGVVPSDKIHSLRLIPNGNSPEGLIRQGRRRRRLILDGTSSDGLIRWGKKKRNSSTNFLYSQSDMCCQQIRLPNMSVADAVYLVIRMYLYPLLCLTLTFRSICLFPICVHRRIKFKTATATLPAFSAFYAKVDPIYGLWYRLFVDWIADVSDIFTDSIFKVKRFGGTFPTILQGL
jgi:hypothetical protein